MITRVAWLTAVAIVGCTDAASAPRSRCVDRPVGVWKAIGDAPAKTLRRIDRPAAVWLDDRVWIWDGAGPITASRFYDTCTDAWLPSGLPPGADKLVAAGPQAFRVGNKLMIAGMDEGSGFNVLVFDRAAWKTIKTPGAFEMSPLVVRTDDRLIAWSPAAAWIFDLVAQKWSRMSQRGGPRNAGNSYSCGAAAKDKWFVWDDGELLRYGFASNTWSRLASVTRSCADCSVSCRALAVAGQRIATLLVDHDANRRPLAFGMIDPVAEAFTKLATPPATTQTELVSVDGALVARGIDANGGPSAAMFDPTKRTWTQLAMPKLPASKCTAVFDPRYMTIFDEPDRGPDGLFVDTTCDGQTPGVEPFSWPSAHGSFVGAWLPGAGGWLAPTAMGTWADVVVAAELRDATASGVRRSGQQWEAYETARRTWTPLFPVAPELTGLRTYGPKFIVYWGLPESKLGNDCSDPFEPRAGGPCDPAGTILYTRFRSGGYILRR